MIFKKNKKYTTLVPNKPLDYPSGTCIRTEKGYFYIKGRNRYRIPTERVLSSWSFPRILASSEAAAGGFKVMGKLGFRDGSLIIDISNGKMYLVSENRKRLIANPDWLYRFGISEDDFISVSSEEANLHSDGEVLN